MYPLLGIGMGWYWCQIFDTIDTGLHYDGINMHKHYWRVSIHAQAALRMRKVYVSTFSRENQWCHLLQSGGDTRTHQWQAFGTGITAQLMFRPGSIQVLLSELSDGNALLSPASELGVGSQLMFRPGSIQAFQKFIWQIEGLKNGLASRVGLAAWSFFI